MTTHKSSAVTSGIMPDFGVPAGVVLCRSAEFVTTDDSIVCGDTLQMVPIPKYAKVLQIQVYHSALPAGTTGCDIGYAGDTDAFAATVTMTAADTKVFPGNALENTAGWLHTFTADDTIDIAFTSLATKIPTSQRISMAVWYKMTGVISDES